MRTRSTLPRRARAWSACRRKVDALLSKIRRKYKEYGINEKPFVVVKADNGTYGMGIIDRCAMPRSCSSSTAAREQDGGGQGRPVRQPT